MDSNHRSMTQQIYSLPPLATREFSHIKLEPRPADYKSAALPTELHQRVICFLKCSNNITQIDLFVNPFFNLFSEKIRKDKFKIILKSY